MQSDWVCGHRTGIFGRTWSQSTWPRWRMMKVGLYIFIGLFFNNPEVLDIMATLSNLAVRAAAFATTYPECLHWKYRQRWVGDMVIYGSLLLQISLIKVFFGPCAVGFGSTKSHKNQVSMIGTKILIFLVELEFLSFEVTVKGSASWRILTQFQSCVCKQLGETGRRIHPVFAICW